MPINQISETDFLLSLFAVDEKIDGKLFEDFCKIYNVLEYCKNNKIYDALIHHVDNFEEQKIWFKENNISYEIKIVSGRFETVNGSEINAFCLVFCIPDINSAILYKLRWHGED